MPAADTVSVRPKHRFTDEIRAAIAAVGLDAIRTVLTRERYPAERASDDHRPKRPGRVGDLKADATAVWELIQAANEPPSLFRSAGLASIEPDDAGHPFAR